MSRPEQVASLERSIDRYCAAWSESDPAERERLLRDVWADDATYTDPRSHTRGLEELVAHIGRVLAGRPGATVTRTTVVDSHHGLVRFGWRVIHADGTMLPEGIDFAEFSSEGKLMRVVGFFGPLAPNANGR